MDLVVIGDICTDIFIYGDCNRLSPEAPVPVFTPIDKTSNPGMAGNVVLNIQSLMPNADIQFFHNKEEITKTRYVDRRSNHMFLRVDDEPSLQRIQLTDDMLNAIRTADCVIVSDYNKGFLSEDDLCKVSKLAKFAIVDTKKRMDPIHLSHFNFIKINEHEANQGVADELKEKTIVTLGPKGAMYMDVIYPSPSPKETIDVSGAGDTFLAGFVTKFLSTNSVSEAIIYANHLSSIVVSRKGVVIP
jgi:D-beta-D-heptose 7-phosphate kinase/D-beta-D-heptose 1-phosphate adenosyltransferase